jgi:hypothetical protein
VNDVVRLFPLFKKNVCLKKLIGVLREVRREDPVCLCPTQAKPAQFYKPTADNPTDGFSADAVSKI